MSQGLRDKGLPLLWHAVSQVSHTNGPTCSIDPLASIRLGPNTDLGIIFFFFFFLENAGEATHLLIHPQAKRIATLTALEMSISGAVVTVRELGQATHTSPSTPPTPRSLRRRVLLSPTRE